MKRILLLMIVCTLAFNACTLQEESSIVDPIITSELSNSADSIKIQALTMELKNMNSEMPQTRKSKFWSRLVSILYSDACGYSWGRKYNLNWKLSLVAGGVASVVNLAAGGNTVVVNKDNVNTNFLKPDYNIDYVGPMDKSDLIGTIHNTAIAQLGISLENGELAINESLVQKMSTQVRIGLENSLDKNYSFPKAELSGPVIFPTSLQSSLITFTKTLAAQNNLDDLHQMAVTLLPSEKFMLDLLEQCVIRISSLDNKDNIRLFVLRLNREIDKLMLNASQTEYLKSLVAIAENSYSLWNVE